MRDRLATGLGALGGAIGAVLVFLFIALQFGLWAPVVRQHCPAENRPGSVFRVESGWALRWPVIGADDSGLCVRNTLTREALAAVGIWPLDDPRTQVETSFVGKAGDSGGEAAADYVESMIELRRRSDAEARQLARSFRTAETPEEVRAALTTANAQQEQLLRDLRAADPPDRSTTRLNHLFIQATEEILDAGQDLVAAIDTGDDQQMVDAARHFQERYGQAIDDYESAADRLAREADDSNLGP